MWLVAILFIVILGLLAYLDTKKPKNYPPGPKWWPVVGSAPTISAAQKRTGYMYEATAEMCRKYGPVLGLKVGKDKIVVVYGPQLVREFLASNDLAGRPQGAFFEMRTWGKRRGIMLTDEGFWQEQRRFVLRHLREFGFGRSTMSNLIEEEASHMVEYINESMNNNGSVVFNMENLFNVPVLNTLWKMMAGVRYSQKDEKMLHLQQILSRLFAVISMTGATFSHFPILRFLAPDVSGYNLYIETHSQIWKFLNEEIKKHKETHVMDEPRDLMDVYLDILRSSDCKDSFTEQQLLAVCMDMFMAGSETTSNSLAITFLYLILYPDIQKKAHEEIDRVIGRNKVPSLNDRPNMPYMDCIVLEALRMFAGRAFTVPHRALRDTYLNGYFIPKDVLVIANLHGCMMGPESGFENPDVFNPERFMKNGKMTLPDTYLPFGFGKHRCMGETLARANMFLFATTLLQKFNFSVVKEHPPHVKFVDGVTPGPQHFKALVTSRI